MPVYNYNNLTLHKRLNCQRAKNPSISHCTFSTLMTTCGTYLQLARFKKPGLEPDEDGVTHFVTDKDEKVPFHLTNSTGGVVEIKSRCFCSLCLFDPSWFNCHCSKCLPSHAFSNTPVRKDCPYFNIKPHDTFRVYRNGSLLSKGWTHQLELMDSKCCCIFHKCPTNEEPCLCKRCILDFYCECIVCGSACTECGDVCNVEEARSTLTCKHTKCDPLVLEWATELMKKDSSDPSGDIH